MTFTDKQLYSERPDHAEPDWSEFDALELHGYVRVPMADGGTATEPVSDGEEPDFYGIEAHLLEGGVDSITEHGDWETVNAMLQYLAERTGYPAYVYATPRSGSPAP